MKFSPLRLGPLPAKLVFECIEIEVPEGAVHFSIPAQNHAYRRHGRDFLACMPYLSQAIASPDYIGQSPKNTNGFEVVYSPEDIELNILIAVQIRQDNKGRYQLSSVYPVASKTIINREAKGRLIKV